MALASLSSRWGRAANASPEVRGGAAALAGGGSRGGAAALALLGLRRGRAADPLARAVRRRDAGRERRGEGMIDNPPLFVPRVRIRRYTRGCSDAARVMMRNGTAGHGDCSFGSVGSGRGGAAALTLFGSRQGRAADPSARAARRRNAGRERRGEGTIVDPSSSFCRTDAEWHRGARRRLLVRVALPEGRRSPASRGDDDDDDGQWGLMWHHP